MKWILALLIFLPLAANAQDVTLSWDASPTSGVTGYKIYYQAAPYVAAQWDGTGATEGASPVDVGNVLTYQITNLTDGVIYYFTVTAYDDNGYCSDSTYQDQTTCEANSGTWSTDVLESTYSNIVNTLQRNVLHIGSHGMRFWQQSDDESARGRVRF